MIIPSNNQSERINQYIEHFNNQNDLFEYLKSVGVKTKYKRPEKIAKNFWEKAGIIYNDILQDEREKREVEAKRQREKVKKENKFIREVVKHANFPKEDIRTFDLPRAEVMREILTKLVNNKNDLYLRIGNISYPLNLEFINKMINNINSGEYLVEYAYGYVRSSDEQAVFKLMNSSTFSLIAYSNVSNKVNKKKKKGGGFFKYNHNIKGLDLTDYQISFSGDDFKIYDDSCFIQAITKFFEKNNIDAKSKISRVKSQMTSRVLTTYAMETIAKELEVSISIKDEREIKGKNSTRLDIKNQGCELTIPLGIVDKHYILIEEVPITKYALTNYEKLQDVDRWNEVYRSGNKRSKDRFMNSYDVIAYMFKNPDKYLTELTPNQMLATIHYDTAMNIDVYDVNDKDCRDVKYVPRGFDKLKETKAKKDRFGNITKQVIDQEIICYFDFESTTDRGKKHTTERGADYMNRAKQMNKLLKENKEKPNSHKAYLVVFKTNLMKEAKCIEGKFCGKRMLQEVSRLHGYKPIRFIAHNVKYDFQFLYEHLYQVSKIQRGSMLLSARGDFYVDNHKVNFNFVDSYSFITTKLCKFPEMFGFKGEKEIMPYGLWNSHTIDKRHILLTDCVEYCNNQIESMNIGRDVSIEEKEEYFQSFVNKAKEWDCLSYGEDGYGKSVDIMKYSKMYCIVDVEILQKGYEKFREWINEVCELDINNYITLPSVADAYMKKSDVYKDCCEVSGSQLQFIQKCMVGGRTMTRNNKPYIWTGNKKKQLDDLDAVSLYPSAMKRMGGYLMGKPKVLNDKTYDFLQRVDGYFVEITITKVGKNYAFPLMSYVNKDGIRLWTNDMVGKKMWVDKFSLEDLIEFHKIEFEIDKGYYYDEGRNDKIGEIITHLFKTRRKMKDQNNAIEQVYKLLMNSAYGRTLLKPFEDEKVYVSEKRFKDYCIRHYDSIKQTQPLHDNSYEITQQKPIIEHYNLAHIGVEVLSMSKRIMNEVMCLGEDIGVEIYYQDTDSTHTPVEDIPRLKEAYFKKYGRELEGDEMSQFNCDFKSKKLKKKWKELNPDGDFDTDARIVSEESVFLGKKCYCDKLIIQGDDDGKIYGVDNHIRMKGVSEDAIADKLHEDDIDPIELYTQLHDSKLIEFDLSCRGKKACFETMEDGTMTTREVFGREIQFKYD